MNLYLISQTENSDYDTYDSAVVCAANETAARNTSPSDGEKIDWTSGAIRHSWCSSPKAVEVILLGRAKGSLGARVVCASFNAG